MKTTVEKSAGTPTRWQAGGPFAALRDEMDSLLSEFWGNRGIAQVKEEMPRLDLSETDTAVEVKTDLPGFKPEEVSVELLDNVLTIHGKHEEENRTEGDGERKYHRVERRTGEFRRSVWLPAAVKSDAVDAQLVDGVLTVTLPKVEEARPLKVPVKVE